MISRRFRRRHKKEAEELNITPFMNLMVILLPFLLTTAALVNMAVLDVSLPTANTQSNDVPNDLRLEVIVRDVSLVVADGRRRLATINRTTQGGYDYEALSDLVQKLKQSNPEASNARILLQPDTAYDVLIHVMDAMRMVREPDPNAPGEFREVPLFPQIALGDAP